MSDTQAPTEKGFEQMQRMTGERSDIEGVVRVLQRVYEDVSLTKLDYDAANAILSHLREAGWVTPEEAAMMVVAAGGRIEVSESLVINPPTEWRRWRNPMTGAVVLEATPPGAATRSGAVPTDTEATS